MYKALGTKQDQNIFRALEKPMKTTHVGQVKDAKGNPPPHYFFTRLTKSSISQSKNSQSLSKTSVVVV